MLSVGNFNIESFLSHSSPSFCCGARRVHHASGLPAFRHIQDLHALLPGGRDKFPRSHASPDGIILEAVYLALVEQMGKKAVGGKALHCLLLGELVSSVGSNIPDGQVQAGGQSVQ